MNYTKKQKYLTEFVKSIQRKALYSEPLFLLDVQQATKKQVVGSSDNIKNKFETGLPLKIEYNKELFRNISSFADKSIESKRLISNLLRNILLGKAFSTPLKSIKESVLTNYTSVALAYTNQIDQNIVFSQDCVKDIKESGKKTILVVDFDVGSEEESNVAASIKQLFFGYRGTNVSYPMQSVIDYTATSGYELSAYIPVTYPSDIIKSYALLFTKG